MTSIAVIQARTNSTRLPGKVLLPMAGMPMAVLAAKRAANTGRKVVVATSVEKSDDGLVALLRNHGIPHYRGSLDDTLSRFTGALRDFSDDTVVFRLTADNVLPDGGLLDEIEHEFHNRSLEYLACNGMESGLPYGLSAEVTRLAHLKEAERSSSTVADREHVTPWVIRKFGTAYFRKYLDRRMGHYRCTIDCLDDYLSVEQLFRGEADPVGALALDLIEQLKGADLQPQVGTPVGKLVLGAAQLGMRYGIANVDGQPDAETARHLVRTAIANGVQYIDTARAYGDSENVIRQSLEGGWQGRAHVITKMAPLVDCPPDASGTVVDAFVDSSLYCSLATLGVRKIDTMLLHRASQLRDWNGRAWQRLVEHRHAGRIERLGVSVQSPEELLSALQEPLVSHIQLPLNIMDGRWDALSSHINDIKAERPLTIHIRSLLLQGLLCSDDPANWQRAHVTDPTPIRDWLHRLRDEFGRTSVADLCIGFAAAIPWVDGVVIGSETMEQLSENLRLLENLPLSDEQMQTVLHTRPQVAASTLNPALWRQADQCA